MASKNIAVYGIFRSRTDLDEGVAQLKADGFRHEDISVLLPSEQSTKEFAHTKGTKAPEGASAGTASGAVIGGTLGWLAGIGSIAIPGVGPFIAAGPIMAALAGAGVGGALGGIAGALVGMGVPEYEAKRYEGLVKKGGILCSVHCDNNEWRDKARDILDRTGAEEVSSKGEAGAEEMETDRPYPKAGNY